MITRDTPNHTLLILLYRLIEEGTVAANSFFDDQPDSPPPDPFLYPGIVRWHIARALDGLNDTSITYERTELPNNGIEVRYAGQRIKVFKSTPEGELPAPGSSIARQGFYQWSLFGDDEQPTNLVVMWEVDSSYNLNSVQLVCPRADGPVWKPGQQDWAITLPHPASIQMVSEVAESEDLYYEHQGLDIEEGTGTENE